jgi:hypothetical protein
LPFTEIADQQYSTYLNVQAGAADASCLPLAPQVGIPPLPSLPGTHRPQGRARV